MYVSKTYWCFILLSLGPIYVSGHLLVPETATTHSPSARPKQVRRLPLNDQELLQLMVKKGVPFLPDYMAVNEAQANEQFPKNMLELTEMYKDQHSHLHGTAGPDNARTRVTVLEHMRNYHAVSKAHSHLGPRTQNLLGERNKTANLFHRNVTSMVPKFGGHFGSKRPKRRIKRQIDSPGATTVTDYCKGRGSLTTGNLTMRMCKTCAATTTLPETHFPRVINEVICSDDDRTCLTVDNVAHGKCRQKVFHLNMLRKRNSTSILVNQETTLSDEWEVYTQPIRISCDCEVDKRSIFARYVCGPDKQGPVCNSNWTAA